MVFAGFLQYPGSSIDSRVRLVVGHGAVEVWVFAVALGLYWGSGVSGSEFRHLVHIRDVEKKGVLCYSMLRPCRTTS